MLRMATEREIWILIKELVDVSFNRQKNPRMLTYPRNSVIYFWPNKLLFNLFFSFFFTLLCRSSTIWSHWKILTDLTLQYFDILPFHEKKNPEFLTPLRFHVKLEKSEILTDLTNFDLLPFYEKKHNILSGKTTIFFRSFSLRRLALLEISTNMPLIKLL